MIPADLIAALNFRYATKSFDPSRKIDADIWDAVEKSLTLAPSSFGLQPWKFLIVTNPEIREQLKAVSWNQPQVTDASHLIVLTARKDLTKQDIDRWINRLAEVQSTPVEDLAGYAGMISSFAGNMTAAEKQAWNTRQVYIALGQLMTASAVMGIDTCPLEGISPAEYDRILGLDDSGFTTVVACAVGYRSANDSHAEKAKARFRTEEVMTRI
ncbi:MAG: hypothetical protein RL346_689 [Verrucomicrobiota bacterium]|jgi:nitroreductase